MTQTKPRKIAVLGGGVGALSAVFYLTETKDWADKYEITVYQQGWRLGGKCASGRDMREGYGYRVYEHGLHIFAGFYDQSFDLLRRSYEAIDRPEGHPNQTVWDAFTPQDTIALVDNLVPGHPDLIWYLNLPANEAVPGDDLSLPPLAKMIERLIAALLHIHPGKGTPTEPIDKRGWLSSLLHKACSILKGLIHKVEDEIEEDVFNAIMHSIVDMIHDEMKQIHDKSMYLTFEVALERFMTSALMVQAILHGVAEDKVFKNGFDTIDNYDWSEWLHKHGLAVARKFPEWGNPEKRAERMINSATVGSLYDYAFALDGADMRQRNFAAGTALHAALRLVTYKGHLFWKMRGSMGDVVIAPIYLALQKRGVKFKFFNRITQLNIAADKDEVASIDLVEQVQLTHAEKGYDPLFGAPVPGWPDDVTLEAWPAEPFWTQLTDGEHLRTEGRNFEADDNQHPGAGDTPRTLQKGVDFDDVILGIPPGGLRQICASFPARLPDSKWGATLEKLSLTRTCAVQLWQKRAMDDLGVPSPDRTLTNADQPLSTWADMSHLLNREIWNGADRPRAITYFCGQIDGNERGAAADVKIVDATKTWMRANTKRYWPKAVTPESAFGFAEDLIYDPEPAAGGSAFDRQYYRINYFPSELYVQSPKGSTGARMDPGGSGLANVYLAGDWTLSIMNSGCVEGAARSGARCAEVISGAAAIPAPMTGGNGHGRSVILPPSGSDTPAPTSLPPYVIDGNLYDSLGPAQLDDVYMHMFCVPADKQKIQAWLDRTFSAPSGGAVSYEALGSKIFLGVAQLGHVSSLGQGGKDKGHTTEIDVTFWILARKCGDGPLAMRWIPAYLFVDSGAVLVTGREVWGFPKQLGKFDFKPVGDDPASGQNFDTQGFVIEKYGPNATAQWKPIINVRPKPKTHEKQTIWTKFEHLAEAAAVRLADDLMGMADHIKAAIAMGDMTMAFLKQFPDATEPRRACYQAIVEAEAKTTTMHGSGLTNDKYEVEITSYASHPFLSELGLGEGWQDVGHGIWVHFDFTQNLGKEIWRA